MSRKAIRVVLVEDNVRDVKMVEAILKGSGFPCQLVGAFSEAETALEALTKLKPDILLVDIQLSLSRRKAMNGIDFVRAASLVSPKSCAMMLTVFPDTNKVFDAIQAGAFGYLLKREMGEKLLQFILVLQEGGTPMTHEIARKVIEYFRTMLERSEAVNLLTPRQLEILRLVAQGFGDKEIASKLNLSPRTVSTHLGHVYEKLHVKSRGKAVEKLHPQPFGLSRIKHWLKQT